MKEKYKNSIVFRFIAKRIIRYALRASLTAAYLWTANKCGLLNHNIATNAIIWLISILAARYIIRDIERAIGEEVINKTKNRNT